MGPNRIPFDLQQLLKSIKDRNLSLEPQHGQYDMPPGWMFRHSDETSPINRLKSASQAENPGVQSLIQEWKNEPEKLEDFLNWLQRQQANKITNRQSPQGYF